jgi:hypothetical protein
MSAIRRPEDLLHQTVTGGATVGRPGIHALMLLRERWERHALK